MVANRATCRRLVESAVPVSARGTLRRTDVAVKYHHAPWRRRPLRGRSVGDGQTMKRWGMRRAHLIRSDAASRILADRDRMRHQDGFTSSRPRIFAVFAIPEIPIPGPESGMESAPSSPRRRAGTSPCPMCGGEEVRTAFSRPGPLTPRYHDACHCPVLTQCLRAPTRAIRATGDEIDDRLLRQYAMGVGPEFALTAALAVPARQVTSAGVQIQSLHQGPVERLLPRSHGERATRR